MRRSEVISKFVRGVLGTYKTQNGSITSIDGVILKSYNTIIAYYDGGKFLISNRKYSKTTSTQQNELKRELEAIKQPYKEIFDVGYYVYN